MKLVKGNKQAGFSLVELMVVVGIIGILASLAVPRLQTFTAKAKISEGRAVVSNLGTLLNAYYAENSVYAPGQLTGAAGAITPVTVPPQPGLGTATNLNMTAVGFSRTVTNQMFYRNPGFVAGLRNVGGQDINQFTVWTTNRLPLCSGINADNMLVAPLMNQNSSMWFGTGAAMPAPTAADAGLTPAGANFRASARFSCN